MEHNTVNAEVLNDLIEINNDRIVGYQKALDELKTEDEDLRSVFAQKVTQSQQLKSDLANEVQVLGQTPSTGTTNSGKIYRTWMDVKAVFTGHDRHTVLNNCEYGEDAAQKAYQSALETDGLSSNLNSLITRQKEELRMAHNQVRSLRDQANHS